MKSKLLPIVAAMFAATPKADTLFMTSDEQGFTDEEKAQNHARYLKDKTIQKFVKDNLDAVDVEQDLTTRTKGQPEADRESLLAEYEELFGKSAAHNIGTETLKQRIDAKQEELKEQKIKASVNAQKSGEEEE